MRSVSTQARGAWFAAFLTPVLAMADAPGDLAFRSVGDDRGLDVSVVADLLFDRRGFLWVGSREGLYCYDGYRATLFAPDADNPDAISDLDVRALYEDRDGVIWVATNTGGLNRFDPRTGKFRSFRHDSADPGSISHDSVYGMTEDGHGNLWAGTQIGLNRLDRGSGRFTRYRHDPADPASLSHDYVYDVFLDRHGVLWIATIGGGLSRYNAASDDFTHFDLAATSGCPADCGKVFGLAEDEEGTLWIGTRSGLLRFNAGRTEVERVSLAETGTAEPTITTIEIDRDGRLWMGSMANGVLRFDPRADELHAYADYSRYDPDGLAAQPQLSLALRRDALFVGTWGAGLWMTRLPDARFRLLGADAKTSALRHKTVMAVLGGPEPGRPWVGSFGGGPQPANVEDGTFGTPYDPDSDLARDGVLALARAADGRVFAGTNHGLWELESDGSVRAFFEHRPGQVDGLGEGYITSLHFDAADRLWVGVGGSGLYRLVPGEEGFAAFRHDPAQPDSLSGDYITTILRDDDRLWIGTRSNGLNRCRISPWSCQRFGVAAASDGGLGHFHVTALHRDGRGRLWVATDGGGLHEVLRDGDGEVLGFRRWTDEDGLVSSAVMAIEEDDDGSLWLSTRQGLTRLDPAQGRVANAVEQSGLPVTHFHANASGSDGRYLYFGSVEGLLVIPRGRPFSVREPTPTRITAVQRIGEAGYRPATGWVPSTFEADYGDMLAIEFASLDYAEVPHRYEFRLGEAGAWTPLGQRTEVTFLDLAPGRHRFAVRGRDVFGLWSAAEPLEIQVTPPFWLTTWFRLLVVAVLLLGLFGLHRLRTHRLERRALEMQRLGEVREQALEQALGDRSELAGLTPRQKEVLQLIAEGHSTREMAERLGVSVKTVETHRANLMERLEIRDVPGLVRLAIRARLVSPHD
jgi:ligand-binding sensor domain-containing protein/DNA-binding CsgD family transcriptional regulator